MGIPIDEATSKDADRDNPKGAYYYEAEGLLDHAMLAEARYWDGLAKEDPHRHARVVRVRRVERRR